VTAARLSDVLDPAAKRGYAIAGLVVLGWEDARAYVAAAEETGIPVILQAGPGCRRHTPTPILGKMFRTLADRSSAIVVCHIDHAATLGECEEGIESGFTSVMIDGSKLPLEENIALTSRVVEAARSAGVSVEGEVGVFGYSGDDRFCGDRGDPGRDARAARPPRGQWRCARNPATPGERLSRRKIQHRYRVAHGLRRRTARLSRRTPRKFRPYRVPFRDCANAHYGGEGRYDRALAPLIGRGRSVRRSTTEQGNTVAVGVWSGASTSSRTSSTERRMMSPIGW
jgi:hypothetical protein